ncbi:hypothetical protein C0995_002976 [Termitomyces sp. Mi166|nr:hypothetical protein C0995_002976 [Termitomyces sp. Mi166\
MGKFYDFIPDFLMPWIEKQKIFWVMTAPLTVDGLVNVSPKSMTGSFHIIDANKTSTDSFLIKPGIETVAHSCSHAVPFMEYKGKRSHLLLDLSQKEVADIAAEKTLDLSSSCKPSLSKTGLKCYWSFRNAVSLCGLSGMLVEQHSRKTFIMQEPTWASRD